MSALRLTSIFYLLPLLGFWLVLIYNLGAQWSVYEQYSYGWAVPILCLYLLWRNAEMPKSGNAESKKQKAESPTPSSLPAFQRFNVSAFQIVGLFLLCLLYAPTRFFHEANPIWRFTSLLWTLEVIGLTLLLLQATHPASPTANHASRLTFPICFFLVAVPWPSGIETFVIQSLMRLNSATTVELLGLFGVPALQHGNVIEVGSGMVGIDEACSGIRSLQATLMISLFLGEMYALSAWRRTFCVFAGFALAFAFNIGRTFLLARVAAAKGVGAVASWHDPAGVTILVTCFLSLWLVARALRAVESGKQKVEEGGPGSVVSGQWSEVGGPVVRSPVVPLSAVSWSLLAWLLVVESGTELWYQSHERATAANLQWSVQHPAQNPSYEEVEIPSNIRGQFLADESTHARWKDGSGNSWQLYYFRWLPAHSLEKRVAIQLAKTHGPEKCLPAAGMTLRAYLGIITVPVAGIQLALQQYVFSAEGTTLHVFYAIYEDPSGTTELANRRKDFPSRVAAALSGSRNYGQRFLEVALIGCERPEDARAALRSELDKIIKVER
jgi:exosortase